MLFDRLVLDVQQAEEAITQRQISLAHDRLVHAQAILLELHAALDVDAWAGASQLSQIYLWINNELIQANINKDAKALRDCMGLLTQLQQAWQGAYEQIGNAPLGTFAVASPEAP